MFNMYSHDFCFWYCIFYIFSIFFNFPEQKLVDFIDPFKEQAFEFIALSLLFSINYSHTQRVNVDTLVSTPGCLELIVWHKLILNSIFCIILSFDISSVQHYN